jgi:hypothetical protein
MGSSIQLYAVTITNGITGNSGSGTDGFIDSTKLETYCGQLGGWSGLETAPNAVLASGLTWALSEAKRRANLRYRRMIIEIELMANVHILSNTITTNATGVTEGASFAFQLSAEHGAASLTTRDELNPGLFLFGAAALQRAIARALTDNQTVATDVYDPTTADSTGLGANVGIARYGVRLNGQVRFDNNGNPLPGSGFFVGPYAGSLGAANAHINVMPLMPSIETFT